MKKILFILSAVALLSFNTISSSCTVTTECGTYTFNQNVNVSVSQTNGQSAVIVVRSANNGKILRRINCNKGSSVSTSCSSGNGGSDDICDSIPAFLRPVFGCN